MILSFADPDTEAFFHQGTPPRAGWQKVSSIAGRKLDMLHAAVALADLLVPPGNRLEALKAGRAGQHSIRINDQWRICFRWTVAGAEAVEIVDYH